MKNETETKVVIILNNGHPCPLPFLKHIKEEILFIAPGVPDGVFTTEQLCGEVFWEPLSDWEKTLAGSCMIHLVEHGQVPFELAPRPGRSPYSLQYRVKV